VLLIQSLLSIVKLILYGFDTEAIVGSMAEKGAELAVVIPLVALIFFWIVKEGKFNGWDYIRMASFFMISLASGKRAPVFLFPVVILALNYIKQGKSLLTLAKYTPFAILILFLGMKLTPTLNPEGKIWGSFDPQHAIDYILIYNFGTSSYNEIISSNYQAKNRGGSLLFFLAPSDIGLNDLKHIAFGRGLYSVTSRELGRFETNFSAYVGVVEYQGLASSIIAIFFSLGYGGVLSLFLISLSILSMISRRQLYVLILCLFLWDFLLYANHMIFSAPSAFILVYLIIYAKLEDQKNSSQKQPKFVGGKFE
jgi:hypothetical protein